MDALASFVYLSDHLPAWMTKIDTLATHVVTKHEEFAAEYRRVLKHARPKRKRTPSVASIRTNDRQPSLRSQRNDTNARENPALPRPSEISPLEPENKYLFANARKGKRRQGTSVRSGASGPHTFRNQHEVIIYYDSVLQNSFEGLIKDIGMARNNLRKGQQARAVERGLRLPAFHPGDYGRSPRAAPALPSSPHSRPAAHVMREQKLLLHEPPPDGDASFAEVTKDLEAAQSLCETAAHQFLRDGDCMLEIDRIRAYFENVSQIAKVQIDALRQERNNSDNDAKTTVVKNEKVDMTSAVAEKLALNVAPAVNSETAEIEVDSDDNASDADVVIDISKFRAARANGIRA